MANIPHSGASGKNIRDIIGKLLSSHSGHGLNFAHGLGDSDG
jgi:hypothetical protein